MRYIFIILLLLAQIYGWSQEGTFPETWQGDWKGTLDIFNGKGKVQSVEMTVEIHKIDTSKEGRYTFGLIYGSKDKDWRPYEIVPVKPELGEWRVDEKNSISMESYLYGPKLLCWFVVENNRILCSYEKVDAQTMIFEVLAGAEKIKSTTGDTMQGTEKIPPVYTYPVSAFQRATLKKQ
jgi:hypothetical protein